MLKHTFCHIPGIGASTEQKLWSQGIATWEQFLEHGKEVVPKNKFRLMSDWIKKSQAACQRHQAGFFARLLPSKESWRLYREFAATAACLDIETTGLYWYHHDITCLALYNGRDISWYVNGQNLPQFEKDILRYNLIITYNGKCFDVPFIEHFFKTRLTQAHIDLRYVLYNLGYKGGLKGCEKQLGLERGDLEGIDGDFGVVLWHDYQENGHRESLETLLAYNILDTIDLHLLMAKAYNMNVRQTPFADQLLLPEPSLPTNPFKADLPTINRLHMQMGGE